MVAPLPVARVGEQDENIIEQSDLLSAGLCVQLTHSFDR